MQLTPKFSAACNLYRRASRPRRSFRRTTITIGTYNKFSDHNAIRYYFIPRYTIRQEVTAEAMIDIVIFCFLFNAKAYVQTSFQIIFPLSCDATVYRYTYDGDIYIRQKCQCILHGETDVVYLFVHTHF